MGDADEILDRTMIESLRELSQPGDDVLAAVTAIFMRDGAKWAAAVRAAARDGDGDAMWKAAHELRSVAANAGATRVAALCDDLQERGLAGRLGGVDDVLSVLDAELDRAWTALTRLH